MAEIPCHENSLDDPERFKLVLAKIGKTRVGKMMTYHAQSGQSCDAEVTDASSMNIYTDFVALEAEVKANIYLLGRQVTSFSDIDSYGIGSVCVNFPQYCKDSSLSYTSIVPNPLCLSEDHVDGVWGSSCVDAVPGLAKYRLWFTRVMG